MDGGRNMSLSTLKPYKSLTDPRGFLGVIDDRFVPFNIRRVFWISNVPAKAVRGQHAHRRCHQAIICLAGSFDVWSEGMKYELSETRPTVLYIPPLSCIELKNFTKDAIALVLASEYYDEDDVVKC